MARTESESAPAENTAASTPTQAPAASAPTVEGAAPAAATTGTGHHAISFALDTQGAKDFGGNVGDTVTRKAYILKRYEQDGIKRGPISKELSRLEGREVPYQIVFQATKGKVQGTPKVVEGAPATATTTEGQPAATEAPKVAAE
jgi:hypothetical protein